MQIPSETEIKYAARQFGYRPELLEKVYRLLDLLEVLMSIPFVCERLVLKGGTAINLFHTEELPRLSIDLDFNYIGASDKETMQKEKIELENVLLDICRRLRYTLDRNPRAHAGGKMILAYQGNTGGQGRLELDLNYLFRVPLWEPVWRESPAFPKKTKMRVLDMHELAAGKLHALLGREASRDLFDSHHILKQWKFDQEKLRIAFTIYAGMRRDLWQQISINNIKFTIKDIRDKLIPVLRSAYAPATTAIGINNFANKLIQETRDLFSGLLPFREHEIAFLRALQEEGIIRPEYISDDSRFCERVRMHPSLLWRIYQNKK